MLLQQPRPATHRAAQRKSPQWRRAISIPHLNSDMPMVRSHLALLVQYARRQALNALWSMPDGTDSVDRKVRSEGLRQLLYAGAGGVDPLSKTHDCATAPAKPSAAKPADQAIGAPPAT